MHIVKREIAGRTLKLESGRVARQSESSVLIQYGETIVLVCVNYKKEIDEVPDFLPLTVDYREMTYAAGKIPGGFFKRESRPREKEILISRLIDRPLRPLFPKDYRNETQIIGTLLSADIENEGDILGIIGASTALCVSEIPYKIPVGAVRIGKIGEDFIINPTISQTEDCILNLVVAGTEDSIMMIEGGGFEFSEEDMIKALTLAQEEIKKVIELEKEMIRLIGKEKLELETKFVEDELVQKVGREVFERVSSANGIREKNQREEALNEIIDDLLNQLKDNCDDPQLLRRKIAYIIDDMAREDLRKKALIDGIRIDGRKFSEIRPVTCQIGILPRTHGSALFTRGQTQSLAVTTLGTASDEQIVDDLEGEESKSFMLHYNFPPFSVGEVRPLRGPGRREIGHGALAERALLPVLPKEDDFPYTIRVVSDILESNGSSSMASVCGASLSLMDAGIPIKTAVAGVSIGLIKEDEQYVLLTDIIGAEDHYGDMDFKIAGTKNGISGVQLDIKIQGVSIEILKLALERAREARLHILEIMSKTISAPRSQLSRYAPRISAFRIPKDKIGDVIGPGGKTIRRIIDETGVTIDIDDDGKVTIAGNEDEAIEKAQGIIEGIVSEVEVGRMYIGKVKRLTNFGAFVEILPGKEGMIHISRLTKERSKRIEDLIKVGDEVIVKVINIDDLGRINLTRQ
ncbi:MAG: polyribonucleotide nucleotidyltransferase [candidate division WOR-3 bacterium]